MGFRALTLAPVVSETNGVLVARSSILLRVITLGAFRRQLVVDRRSRFVNLETRVFWLFKRARLIPFRQVHRIAYDYAATTTSVRRGFHGAGASADEIETFSVSLVVRPQEDIPESHQHLEEEHVHLFSFHGDGLGYAGNVVDFEGQQSDLSRHFVDRLQVLIGVGFGNELVRLSDAEGRGWSCESCERPGPPRPGSCYYCGGRLRAD